jgi:hypothetical protein
MSEGRWSLFAEELFDPGEQSPVLGLDATIEAQHLLATAIDEVLVEFHCGSVPLALASCA